MLRRFLLLALAALTLLACAPANAATPQPPPASPPPGEPTPAGTTITSAGDPTAPVPFRWTIHESHRPDGHRLRLQGGTIHAIASEARLIDPTGIVVASVPAMPLTETNDGLCGDGRRGLVGAEVPLPPSHLDAFNRAIGDSAWPAGYRVEVQVGGNWRPAQLTFAGCVSIEQRSTTASHGA